MIFIRICFYGNDHYTYDFIVQKLMAISYDTFQYKHHEIAINFCTMKSYVK